MSENPVSIDTPVNKSASLSVRRHLTRDLIIQVELFKEPARRLP